MQNSIVLFLIGLLCFSHNTYGQPITVVTEHLPPMQIVNNGKLTGGVGTEVVRMMLDKVEGGTKIVPMNWARAYLIAKTQKNVLIFSITRNAERENQFKWVGPIATFDNYIWRLKLREDIVIERPEDAFTYKIAVPRDDMQHEALLSLGFKDDEHLIITSNYSTAVRLVMRGRIEMLTGNRLFLSEQMKKAGFNIMALTPVYKLAPSTMYVAFGNRTDDSIVEHYRQALMAVKAGQRYRKLMEKWQLRSP